MLAQTKTAEPKVVNGINVDDLFALIEGVRRDPAKGQTSWRVTTAWQGQTRSRTQVEGFDEQAVSGHMAALHGTVAQQMGVGYGGVYYHLWGNMDPHVAERAQWLSRPRGIEFRPVLEGMSRTTPAPVSVWRRFMVLGPGSEFVILGDASLELRIPDGWAAHRVTRTVLS